ncbi:aminopeptidase P family protein [Streptomyces sp. NBC_01775]|uniref:aminopeptidase P family protein n=1 Tax=Streptomyces sp. NBC_01775 TaxID=2975939 RepID=UPI002DDB9228|nr:aminopeptidase P family protein [Streptomyces sp. NBC_01775]WSB80732.1 aminopeptidase P family protein [Streptomyces sp. NBC_01775]
MSEVHVSRRSRLRDRCAASTAHDGPADAVLVSSPANVRYLTGRAAPDSVLLLGADGRDTLVSVPGGGPLNGGNPADGLRETVLDAESAENAEGGEEPGEGREAMDGAQSAPRARGAKGRARTAGSVEDAAVAAAGLAARGGAGALAVEEHHLTVARHRALATAAPGLRLADLGLAVEQQRVVKDEEEISALRIAAEITDQALGELLESILVGRTERHLALELERRLIDHGAEGAAFPTSVATGPHSGLPGHRPTDRRVEEGDFLTVRLGARYRGYRCQIGRTFVIGTAPEDWQIELYDLVFAAQRAAREALGPGTECREVDLAARQVLDAAGHGAAVEESTGHGVGLEIGEDPRLSPAAMGKLDACVPVTVEPGVHLPGRGGVRIDDTLVVRPQADGGPELLTITTKELLAL